MSPTLSSVRARRSKPRVEARLVAQYESAMFAVRELAEQCDVARSHGLQVPLRRGLHARLDYELMRAIAAARAIHDQLFEAAGGQHHAEAADDVALWKRHLNEALTLRSKHQLAAMDDTPVVAATQPRTRAASGPHQAGLEFDTAVDPVRGARQPVTVP